MDLLRRGQRRIEHVKAVKANKAAPDEFVPLLCAKYMRNTFLWCEDYSKQPTSFKIVNASLFVILPVYLTSIFLPSLRDTMSVGERCENLSVACGTLLNISKLFWFSYRRAEIALILRDFEELAIRIGKRATDVEELIHLRNRAFYQEMIAVFAINASCLAIPMSMGITGLLADPPEPMVDAVVPFDTTAGSRGFYLLFLFQAMSVGFLCFNFSLNDLCIGIIYNQITVMFKYLNHNLAQLGGRQQTRSEEEQEYRDIKAIIRDYNDLNAMVSRVNAFYYVYYLLLNSSIIAISVTGCFAVMISYKTDPDLAGRIVFYTIYCITMMFYWCFLGERLKHESMQLSESFYRCEWMYASARFKKLGLLFMVQTQQALRINAPPLYEMNFILFMNVISNIYYFSAILYDVIDVEVE